MNNKFIIFPGNPIISVQKALQKEQDEDIKEMFDSLMHYFNNTEPTFVSAMEDKLYEDTKIKITNFMQRFLNRNTQLSTMMQDPSELENFYQSQLEVINDLNLKYNSEALETKETN